MIILITLPTLSDSVYGFDLSDYENQAEYWGTLDCKVAFLT